MPRGVVKRIPTGNTIELRSGEIVQIAGLDAPSVTAPGGSAAQRRLQRLLRRGTSVGLSDAVGRSGDSSIRKITIGGKNVASLPIFIRSRSN
jgi:hypothetical protein